MKGAGFDWRSWARSRLRVISVIALIGLLSPALSYLLPDVSRFAWPTDLLTHWQWIFVPLALTGAVLGWRGLTRWTMVAAVVASAALAVGLGATHAPAAAPTVRPVLTVLSANVHLDAVDVQPLAAWAVAQGVDVLLMQEVSPGFAESIESGAAGYSFRFVSPRDDPFGLAIVSRYPLDSVSVAEGPGRIPFQRVSLAINGRAVSLVNAHPFPPISETAHQERSRLLRELDGLAAQDPSLIVAGDLNASPWSSAFRDIGHLRVASRALPTWHGVLPIDHVLVGPAWSVVEAGRTPRFESDHHGVIVRLAGD